MNRPPHGPSSLERIQLPAQRVETDVYEDELLKPIPLEAGQVPKWKTIPIRENNERLVPLGAFSDNRDILSSSVYAGEHSDSPYILPDENLPETLHTMFVREGVADRLVHAQQLLPEGHFLMVNDSYRPVEVQKSLYDHYYNKLKTQHPELSEEELSSRTQDFVSIPSMDPSKPSPHNTGGSVDVVMIRLSDKDTARVKQIDTELQSGEVDPDSDDAYVMEMVKLSIIRLRGKSVNFGTPFDHGGEAADLAYYEQMEASGTKLTPEQVEARDNRRILYNAMTGAGFQPYFAEWWHFNAPESQMGAATAGLDHAEYGAAQLDADNQHHEFIRKAHARGIARMQEDLMTGVQRPSMDPQIEHYRRLNLKALRLVGDPRLSVLDDAEVIAPPEDIAA